MRPAILTNGRSRICVLYVNNLSKDDRVSLIHSQSTTYNSTYHIAMSVSTIILNGITAYSNWKIQCKLPPKTKAILPP